MSGHNAGTVEGTITFSKPSNFETTFTIPGNADPKHPEERTITYTGTIALPSGVTYSPGTGATKVSLHHTAESTIGEHDYSAEKVGNDWKVTVTDGSSTLTATALPGSYFVASGNFSGKATLVKAAGK